MKLISVMEFNIYSLQAGFYEDVEVSAYQIRAETI